LGTTFIYVTHDQVEAMTMASRIAVMNEGVLQQVGTPQALYERPDNTFVAGFIGSPSMNFFEATVREDQGEMYLDADTLRAVVPAPKAATLAPYSGKKVIFGLRPEHIHVPEYMPSGIAASKVRARVDVTEMMGNEFFLYLESGDKQFLARVDARTKARPGQEIEIVFDMANMHAFDPGTGKAVLG